MAEDRVAVGERVVEDSHPALLSDGEEVEMLKGIDHG